LAGILIELSFTKHRQMVEKHESDNEEKKEDFTFVEKPAILD
jgi:hypothetical protein